MKGGAPRAVWLVLYADPMLVSARWAADRLLKLGRPCHLVWNPVSGEIAQLIPIVRAARSLGWPEEPGTPGEHGWPGQTGEPSVRGGPGEPSSPHAHAWPGEPSSPGAHGGPGEPGQPAEFGRLDDPGWRGGYSRPRLARATPRDPVSPAAPDGLPGVNTEGRICAQIGVIAQAWVPVTDSPAGRLDEIIRWLDSWQVPRGWPAGRPTPLAITQPQWRSRRCWARGGHFVASQVPGGSHDSGVIDIEPLASTGARLWPAPSSSRGGQADRAGRAAASILTMSWLQGRVRCGPPDEYVAAGWRSAVG